MKRHKVIAVLCCLGLGYLSANDLAICAYNPDEIMEKSKERAALVEEIDTTYQKLFDTIKQEESELKDAVTKFQNKVALLSEAAKETEQNTLVRKKRDLDTKAERALEDYRVERQKAELRFVQKLDSQVSQFAQEHHYDLVVPKSPGLAMRSQADKTQELLAYMNKAYEGKSGSRTA
ncbi:OmpH family outer membrane protein [Candidatus Babeliales bacterium]|nr:OmpH family outer membrane protein [Candidatus Babeliales bacterium]